MSLALRRGVRGDRCVAGARRRRRRRDEAAKSEEEDATPDPLLKHADATFATYV
jgi:hypothetical protein